MVVDGTVEGPGVTKLQRAFTFYYIDKRRSSTEVCVRVGALWELRGDGLGW